jgi:hypothetical protein
MSETHKKFICPYYYVAVNVLNCKLKLNYRSKYSIKFHENALSYRERLNAREDQPEDFFYSFKYKVCLVKRCKTCSI